MNTMLHGRIASFAVLLSLLGLAGGCAREQASATPEFAAESLPAPAQLARRIDDVLRFTLAQRRLNSQQHAAWQVVHGVLAYGSDFPIRHADQDVPALDWLLKGASLRGWNMRPGDHGVLAVLEPGTKEGQGHPDQWLGYLSQTGLGLDEPLVVGGREYRVRDLLAQAKADIYEGMEATWTLMALSAYLPLDAEWQNKRGENWTIERVVAMEAATLDISPSGHLDAGDSPCGGTHRLYALSIALNRYLAETGTEPDQLTGGWLDANNKLEAAKRTIRDFQQPDDTFSVHFLSRPGTTAAIAERIGTTGHQFEVLATCMTQQELEEPWMVKAADQLCRMLEQTKEIELECGGLYHAAHGLFLYRQRRFGEVRPATEVATASDAATKQ